jgi:hypothetical protein
MLPDRLFLDIPGHLFVAADERGKQYVGLVTDGAQDSGKW